MKRLLVCILLAAAPIVRAANWPDRPTLRAVRAAVPPTLDGDLSDPAWQSAPEFTDFTQHDPHDGQPATLRTSFRVVYDDQAIYFGAFMEDTHPPTALLARRDSFVPSDFLSINVDPQHDRLSGAAFTITPANVQIDTILYNDVGEDGSWDAVWESETKILPNGWTAEVRVPFSQLRFPEKPVHVWGINVTRRTVRNNEWARIVNTRKGETGFVSHFADLVGLEGIHRRRPLELVPYAVARSDIHTRANRANPLLDERGQRIDGGLDLKYALTSTLTLTGTINPDFGQVEVDPAVVNLSQFETFYPEKRPFFTEGVNIFAFGDSPSTTRFHYIFPPSLFYSRRIGRSPQGSIDAEFVERPSETTILGAAKITGKLGNGWSIGVLDALTAAEHGRFVDGRRSGRQEVEPMTNYFVSRATREIGSSRVGFLLTSVNRRLPDELSMLRQNAFSLGVDGYTVFRDRSWIFEWSAAGTHVSGSAEAMALTQTSSARYYQRPDASHVELDPTRTSLTGHSGRVMLSRQSGRWRPNVQVQAYSPGFESGDAGFMERVDIISGHAMMLYINEEPTARTRERRLFTGLWSNHNFDGDTVERGVFVDGAVTLANYWEMSAQFFVLPGALSDQRTRGGPLVRTQRGWILDTSLQSDSRRAFSFSVETEYERNEDGTYDRDLELELSYRPSSNLVLSVGPAISRSREAHQYVTTIADPSATGTYGRRYVFAALEQRTFELGTRVDWTLSPRLSFQLYVQPFIASGDYHDVHALARARTADYVPYAGPTAVREPDFNYRSVRGSAVARWEFRPGSALYVVWNENREDDDPVGDFRFRRDLRALSTARSHDVFLVKVSYWLPL